MAAESAPRVQPKIDTDWNGESLFLAVADGLVRMWRDGEEVELMLASRVDDRAAVTLTDVQADGLATALASAAEIIRQERAAARRKARE